MWRDPIVEEVHRVRKQLLALAQGNLRKVINDAARRQKGSGHAILEPSPRPPAGIPKKASAGKL